MPPDVATDSKIEITWRLRPPTPSRRQHLKVILGALLAVLGGVAFFGTLARATLNLEDGRKFVGVTLVIAGTCLIGVCIGGGIRLMSTLGYHRVSPLKIRLGIWICVFLCLCNALHISSRWLADESLRRFDSTLESCGLLTCIWFGLLQLLVLLRMPQIARSLDERRGDRFDQ